MVNILQEALADDGKQMVDEIGYEVVWNGGTYRALMATPNDVEVNLDTGGFMESGGFHIKILRTAFNSGQGPFPEADDRIAIGAETYRVDRHRNKPGAAFIFLGIEP